MTPPVAPDPGPDFGLAQVNAERVTNLAQSLRSVIDLGEYLGRLGSLERVYLERDQLAAAARAEHADVLAAIDAAKAELATHEAAIGVAKATAQQSLDAVATQAEAIVAKAQGQGEALLADAQATVGRVQEIGKRATVERDAILAEIAVHRETLAGLQGVIQTTRDAITKLTATPATP